MSVTVDAVFDGQVFRPTDAVNLPANAHYRLTVESLPAAGTGDLAAFLESSAGSVGGPADWSRQHDHYLYGTPKADDGQ